MEWLAISISIISAFFAGWSWKESKKANSISKHPMQLKIYDAFNELTFYVSINGMSLEMQEVAKFYKFSQKSEFYFDKSFAKQLKRYFDICRKLADLNRKSLRDQEDDEKIEQIEREQDILFDKEIQLSKEIEEKFKSILKL